MTADTKTIEELLVKKVNRRDFVEAEKGAEEARRESETRFQAAQELSLDGFTLMEAVRGDDGHVVDFRWTYVNPQAGRMLRQSPEALIGQRLLEVLPGNQAGSDLFEHYVRVVETGEPHDYELLYQSEGIEGWFRNMTIKVGDGIAVCFTDITQRRKVEESLRKSEERSELLSQTISALLTAIDPQDVVEQLCNEVRKFLHCAVFFNYLLDPHTGRLKFNACGGVDHRLARLVDDLELSGSLCGTAAQNRCRVHAESLGSSSDPRSSLVRSLGVRAYACHPLLGPANEVIGTLSFGAIDRDSFRSDDLELMKTVADNVAVAMLRSNIEKALKADLAALTRMHDLSGKLLGTAGLQPLLQEAMDAAVSIVDAAKGTLQLFEAGTLRIVAHHGHEQPFLDFFMAAENVASVCGEAMQCRERVVVPDVEVSRLFSGNPSLAVLRASGVRAVQSTPLFTRAGRLLGILTTQWPLPHVPDVHDLRRLDLLARQITDMIERTQAEDELKKLNEILEQRVVERTAELREKDRLLMIQGRQAAMGEMIGNIAHQWRQPLNSLGLKIQQLGLYYDLGEFNRDFLNAHIETSMEILLHMSKTIDDFRNFFKPDKEKTDFKVGDVVTNMLSMLGDSLKNRNIGVDLEATHDVTIHGYQNEFSQALLNILNNAGDVFEERQIENPVLIITTGQADGKVVVTVSDNAGGIPEPIINKIFDPYFSTKGPQQGTGLGLFMAKTIIEKNMGGSLSVRNTLNGAEFRIEV